jgi:hypothetical protein
MITLKKTAYICISRKMPSKSENSVLRSVNKPTREKRVFERKKKLVGNIKNKVNENFQYV